MFSLLRQLLTLLNTLVSNLNQLNVNEINQIVNSTRDVIEHPIAGVINQTNLFLAEATHLIHAINYDIKYFLFHILYIGYGSLILFIISIILKATRLLKSPRVK